MIFDELKPPYFWADPHFGHDAIIEKTGRPWKNATVMDKWLIKIFNEVVREFDPVIIVGDFSLKRPMHKNYLYEIVRKLNGIKILVLGNHDVIKPFDYIDMGFHSVHTSLDFQFDEYRFIVNHDPAIHIMCEDAILIHGHVHTLYKTLKNCVNVSVEMWNYKPVSMWEIIGLIKGGILQDGCK